MNIRQVLTITFSGHLLNHSLTLIYPVIMVQLVNLHPEASLTTLGLLGTVHYVLYGAGAPPAGWLTDRLGPRNVLMIYFIGSAFAVAMLIMARSLVQLASGLALLGLFCSLYHPAGLTLISHQSARISRHLGLHGIAGSLGLALGPLAGGVMASVWGWTAPYIFFGLLSLVTGVYVWLKIPSEKTAHGDSHPQAERKTRWAPLVISYIVGVFMGLAHRGTLSFMPLHFSQTIQGTMAPVLVGGFLTAVVLASGILGQILGGHMGDRYPRHLLLWLVVAANIPLLILMARTEGLFLVLVGACWGVANFTYQPIANALISDYSSLKRRGVLFGILHGLTFGVGALASTLAGAIGDAWGTANIFLAMGLVLIPAAAVALLFRRWLPAQA